MGVFPSQPRRGLLGFGLTLRAAGCIQPPPSPAANVCLDPLPNAGGVGDGAGGGDAGSAGLRHTSPPGPCPHGSGSVSSNRSFQSCPGWRFGRQSLRGSHPGSRGASAAGRHPGRGKSRGCVTGSPCLSFILTAVALINHRAPVNGCKTVPVTPGCVRAGTELAGARRASPPARRFSPAGRSSRGEPAPTGWR